MTAQSSDVSPPETSLLRRVIGTNTSLCLSYPIPALEGPVQLQVQTSLNWLLRLGKSQP